MVVFKFLGGLRVFLLSLIIAEEFELTVALEVSSHRV